MGSPVSCAWVDIPTPWQCRAISNRYLPGQHVQWWVGAAGSCKKAHRSVRHMAAGARAAGRWCCAAAEVARPPWLHPYHNPSRASRQVCLHGGRGEVM